MLCRRSMYILGPFSPFPFFILCFFLVACTRENTVDHNYAHRTRRTLHGISETLIAHALYLLYRDRRERVKTAISVIENHTTKLTRHSQCISALFLTNVVLVSKRLLSCIKNIIYINILYCIFI